MTKHFFPLLSYHFTHSLRIFFFHYKNVKFLLYCYWGGGGRKYQSYCIDLHSLSFLFKSFFEHLLTGNEKECKYQREKKEKE